MGKMDYSLLVGIHFINKDNNETDLTPTKMLQIESEYVRRNHLFHLLLYPFRVSFCLFAFVVHFEHFSTSTTSTHVVVKPALIYIVLETSLLSVLFSGLILVAFFPPQGTIRHTMKYTILVPSSIAPLVQWSTVSGESNSLLGIIDFLQDYNVKKKMEYTYKTAKYRAKV